MTPIDQSGPPYWVWNAGMRQLYLSAFHLSLQSSRDYFAALTAHEVSYLLGYPAALNLLAGMALQRGLAPLHLKMVFTNAEMLSQGQRETIQAAFGCPVRDTYGMSELAAAASECSHGEMHLWPDAGLVEVLADSGDVSVPAGQSGRLICTGLINPDMPLIRYQVGDRGALAPYDGQTVCGCGRRLPVLASLDGRQEDVLVARDGRLLTRLDSIFKTGLDIREAQLIQESQDFLRVCLVPGKTYSERTTALIADRIRERMGDMRIEFEFLEKLPRGANGKFKLIINRMESNPGRNPLP